MNVPQPELAGGEVVKYKAILPPQPRASKHARDQGVKISIIKNREVSSCSLNPKARKGILPSATFKQPSNNPGLFPRKQIYTISLFYIKTISTWCYQKNIAMYTLKNKRIKNGML